MKSETTQSRWSSKREELVARWSAHLAQKALERDLAAIESPSELTEMNAILARYDGAETNKIREILNRQHAA